MKRSARAGAFGIVVVLVVTIGLAAGRGAAEESGRTVTKQYLLGDGHPWMTLAWCDLGPVSIGAVCLGQTAGGHVTVSIEDDSGRRVGGHLEISDGNANALFTQPFCGSVGPIAVQPGVLHIHLDGPKSLPSCPLLELSYATKGRVRATFTD